MENLINTNDKYYLQNIKVEEVREKDFRKLGAYKLSLGYYKDCLEITKKFPVYEQDDLGDQLRRSTKKIPAQIAEGNGGIFSKRECYFIGGISLGSLCESQAHLDIALISGFITQEEHRRLDNKADEIKRLLIAYTRAMLTKLQGKQ